MSVNETEVPSKPDFKISNSLFTYLNGPASNKPESLATIMQFIKEQGT